MEEQIDNFNVILDTLDEVLNEVVKKQAILRNAVKEKNWELLVEITKEINRISDYFEDVDEVRNEMQSKMSNDEIKPYLPKLRELRTKLLKCKVENKALGEYVNVTRQFIAEVVDQALPQDRNKNYSRDGSITQPQMQSVLVDLRG